MSSSPTPAAVSPDEGYPQLLSLAVHELRTPVSVVAGYLRLILREGGDPLTEHQLKMLQEAEKACARFTAVVAELSDLSKLDSGQIALNRKDLDVFALAGEVAEHVHEARERDVRLELRGETTGAPMVGDGARLRAAFDAVFRAILREKAGPCTVIVDRRRAARDGRATAVFVVAEETDLDSVFDATPHVFDEKRGGLGLALPLARRVIERHGGRLSSPAPAGDEDARARGSAIICLPMTESKR